MNLSSLPQTLALCTAVLAICSLGHAQPPDPYECCFNATCVTCEQVAQCESFSAAIFFYVEDATMPAANGFGFETGLQNCGVNHPAGVLCTSWTENSFALAGADCLEPACVNLDACNTAAYDLMPWEALAVSDLSLCDFPDPCEDCDGQCLNDINDNNICDCFETFGCMDPLACNYVSESVLDLGDCSYAEPGFDCNGNCLDEDMDGICLLDEIFGCTDTLALNYHPFITEEDGSCVYASDYSQDCTTVCPGDLNGDGVVGAGDLVTFLTLYDVICIE